MTGLSGVSARAAMRCNRWFRDQAAQVIIAELVDLRDFVRSAKAIEEMHERNS